VISSGVGVALSRRGWSLLRASLVLLALTCGFAVATFTCVAVYPLFSVERAAGLERDAVPWLELTGGLFAAAGVTFFVACISVFATGCVIAAKQTHRPKP
jgi:uncharacterized membrane protein YdcZ (DUF606 family)